MWFSGKLLLSRINQKVNGGRFVVEKWAGTGREGINGHYASKSIIDHGASEHKWSQSAWARILVLLLPNYSQLCKATLPNALIF